MIRLSKALTVDHVRTILGAVKTYVDNRIGALAQSVSNIMGDVDTSLNTLETAMTKKGNCEILIFSNKAVAVSAWVADSTYSSYSFRAAISCSGATTNHTPEVIFNLPEIESLNYSPLAQTGSGVVYIYAKEKPTTSITIPTIELRKAVS